MKMPNPNQFPSTSESEAILERSRIQNQETGQKPNTAVKQEGDRFLHISREELMRIDPANLLPSEIPDFIAAHKAWIAKYEKIIAEAKEKEAALATEVEAKATTETESTSSGSTSPDLSGIDVVVADQESVANTDETQTEAQTETQAETQTSNTRVIPVITPEDIPASAESSRQVVSPEKLAQTKEKAKQKGSIKDFLTKKVLPVVLSASLLIGGIVAIVSNFNSVEPSSDQDSKVTETEKSDKIAENQEAHRGIESLNQLINGSFEQDSNIGCYEDNNKVNQASVGNPRAVADYLGIDFDNATPEERGAISEYVNKSMKYPAAATLINHGHPDFAGLSQTEAENKIAHATDQEKQGYQDWLQNEFDHSTYHIEEGKGVMVNHGVIEGADGRHSTYSETDLTGVKILVRTTVQEDGTTVVDYEKDDCANWLYTVVTHSDGSVVIIVPPPSPDTPVNPPTPTPTPSEQINPKDAANLERINQNILDDIAEDIGTGEVRVTPNPGVSQDDLTEKPSTDAYEGTEANIVQNEPSRQAEPVQDQISPENNYSENLGGANTSEYAPVQANEAAQVTANANETPINQAPTGGQELDNVLNDLGIN